MKKSWWWTLAVVVLVALGFPFVRALEASSGKKALEASSLPSGYVAHHFVKVGDSSSRKLIRYLAGRGRDARIREVIHLINGDSETEMGLLRFGFEVESLNGEEAAAKYPLNVMPKLVVKRDGDVLYEGGYGLDQSGIPYGDRRIIDDVLANRTINTSDITSL
ncbi:MAG: hypothetical protein KF802_14525 [Bdellovibrionaceae bacterium]|nr:hypothetical protein [Pseudobdellovibrionaceae bacterium]MBX3033252.1 hypothetical protein [Pseudobdellovibrionaceae bacterium]